MLEFDRTEHPVRDVLLTEPIVHVGGFVTVPFGPGLGIDVDRQAIAHFKVD
jgi:D-galactarolactone cycloisomerase